jgi:hypothetical protein
MTQLQSKRVGMMGGETILIDAHNKSQLASCSLHLLLKAAVPLLQLLRRPSKRYLLTDDPADSPVSDPGSVNPDALTPPLPARRSSSAGSSARARAPDARSRRASAVKAAFDDENEFRSGAKGEETRWVKEGVNVLEASGVNRGERRITAKNQILIPGMDGNEIVMGWGKNEDGSSRVSEPVSEGSRISDASTSARSSRVSRQSRRTTRRVRTSELDTDGEAGVNTLPIPSDDGAGSSATETEPEHEKVRKKVKKKVKKTKSSRLSEMEIGDSEGTSGRKSSVLERGTERKASTHPPPEAPADTGFDRRLVHACKDGSF